MALVRKEGFDLEAFKKGAIGVTRCDYLVRYEKDSDYLDYPLRVSYGETSWTVTNTGKEHIHAESILDIVAMLVEDTPKILSFTVTGLIYTDDAGRQETEVHGRDEEGVWVILKVKANKYDTFAVGSKVIINVED